MRIILYTIFIFLLVIEGSAREKVHQAGLIIGPSLIFNTTSLPIIPGADDCGTFKNGSGLSYHIGGYYSYDYIPDLLKFEGQLFFENRPVDLLEQTRGYEVYNSLTGQYEPLVRSHTYTGNLGYISLDIGAKYKPFRDYPFEIRLGFEAGNPIVSTEYTNTEQIVSPHGILFPNERLTNLVGSGKIRATSSSYGASAAISYTHKLKSGMIISPRLIFRKALNSVISIDDWFQDIVRLSVSIGFDFGDKNELVPIEKIRSETEIPKDKPATSNSIVKSLSTTEIEFIETMVTQTYPILPYIFFDSLNNELKNVYTENPTKNIDESSLPKDNLLIYYRVLDIIGSRMQRHEDAVLHIDGTQDGAESSVFRDYSLARNRAESVKKYLVDTWNIHADRIVTGTLPKATLATGESYPEGFEENRRVELSSNNPFLFEPVVHTKFSEFMPLTKNVIVSTINNKPVSSWQVEFYSDNNQLSTFSGNGDVASVFPLSEIIKDTDYGTLKNLKMRAVFTSDDGSEESINRSIPINVSSSNYELGRLNLIVFDFDRAELTNLNKTMIKNFTAKNTLPESEILITGTTDRLGEKDYNRNLSLRRAENVSKLILQFNPDSNIKEIKGLGSSAIYYDNDSPEGRFYSRTVLIEIKTELK
ncbi:MAG: OmpA family protein [Candidatus Kapabacteria bacterium]|nr:OmpA family protein [Candidatus Kapabacteria bacterium]